MDTIDYSPYEEEHGDTLSQELIDIIIKTDPHFGYSIEDSLFKIREVESPFILSDNYFDLREANNTTIEVGVNKTKSVSFTGGSFYNIYEKVSENSFIVHGNDEEGYNIFILK